MRARWLTTDRWAGSVLTAFALVVLWENRKIPLGTVMEPGPGIVPALLAAILLVCSLAVVAGGAAAPRVDALDWSEWRHAAAILGTCAFMALALERLGYRLTMSLALLGLVRLVERKRWAVAAVFAVGFSLGSHFLFSTILRVPMPQGPFGF
ncbi:MAG: tripartite tricarboxylate transporter TctB family protein [Candidatus Rokubacteria bacterium]|nr:tripartite tricarboxylate transporter TctB family protein [Candidatus Rokubacteria bacterium]